MTTAGRPFDDYLPSVRSAELKSMVRIWGGRSQMRKAECVETIREGLDDPVRVRAALLQLDPLEQCALALVKQAGGSIEYRALAVALYASGWPITGRGYRGQSDVALINGLVRRGLFLTTHRGDPGTVYHVYGAEMRVFSDPRLMAQVGSPTYRPFEIDPVASPPALAHRRPPSVVLDLIGALQAVEQVGGLGVTQKGTVRVGDMRKLARAIGQSQDASTPDALSLPDATLALVSALTHTPLLSLAGAQWRLATSLDQFAVRPYPEQIRPLLYGFASAADWSEWDALHDYRMDGLPRARWALIVALAALPTDVDGFFAIDDLGWALFERIGEHFSFDYVPYRPYPRGKTQAEHHYELQVWERKLRQQWQKGEQQWIRRALSTWLYSLGLVELGLDGRVPVSVRLTELGRSVLHPELGIGVSTAPDTSRAAWVIQPNFDVIVYLDHARPEQMAFIERHAERVGAQQHTAHYRLTRSAVYRGLESGTTLDELLAMLREGADHDLPQNVEVEIREWAALREQIVLHHRARLLEFPDAETCQAAVHERLSGKPVGDRFLLLPSGARIPRVRASVDYARPLPRCLSVSEDGHVQLSGPETDLTIATQLDAWARRVGADVWQLTALSVALGVRGGRRIDTLLKLLDERSTKPIPPLLRLALRAWAGEQPVAHVATVTVLQCPTEETFEAARASAGLRPYLRGVLAPDLLLVDTAQVDAVKAYLAWAGIDVVDWLLAGKGRARR